MRIYVEAFRADGSQMLGNLDGQTAFGDVRDYRRTAHYKALKAGALSVSRAVSFWRVVDGGGRVLETVGRA